MKVIVLGGGAGGLTFATHLKTLDPGDDVEVLERNPADVAYGFGVVFSEQTVNALNEADPLTYRALRENATSWQEIEVRHRGHRTVTAGHSFWAITRRQLLIVLQERAHAAGVRVAYEREVRDLAELADCDLLVAADGVNSFVREAHRDAFGPERRRSRSNYIWLGATKPFPSFCFIFEETDAGAFGAHVYPIGPGLSTFVVDASDETLRRAGLRADTELAPGASDIATLAYLQQVFDAYLDGHELVGNNSRWLKFEEIRNRAWHTGATVLLGDAAHTAHPSVGSGTKMAMEDGLALARSLTTHRDLPTAFETYERARRPAVERIQEAALAGSAWWDWFDLATQQPNEPFVFHYLTRTPRVTRDELGKRDRQLVRQTQAWWSEQHEDGGPPLATACLLGTVELPNRVGASVEVHATDDPLQLAAAVGGAARWGAGLVLVGCASADAFAALARVVELAHGDPGARMAARVELASGDAELALSAMEAAGFDLVVLGAGDPATDAGRRQLLVAAIEAASAGTRLPVVAELRIDVAADTDPGAYLAIARELARAGACGFAVSATSDSLTAEQRRWRQLHLSGLIKLASGLPLVLIDGVENEDQATTALLSQRADVCCGAPRLGVPAWGVALPALASRR